MKEKVEAEKKEEMPFDKVEDSKDDKEEKEQAKESQEVTASTADDKEKAKEWNWSNKSKLR